LLALTVALSFIATPAAPADELVTPTWVGFAITFAMAVITVLLIIDMTRRIRRVRYRSEIREKLEAEQRDAKA
jgi:TRAP-type C4-dicarboxylate transport system permease small subunit